jgi:hypothetical protein
MGMKINIKIINMEKNYYIKFLNYYEKKLMKINIKIINMGKELLY